ncbi:hypothetical protein [Sphingomonas sp.]|uniref:hypothetical protein n=1 Tax=Sphingomonas sp. TaxID=28214 RepID=UPI0031CFE6EB
MKVAILAMQLLALASASPQKKPSSVALKPFEFRGFVAGQEMTPEQAATCHKSGMTTFCGPDDDRVAGVRVLSSYVSAENNRMVRIGISADPIYFGIITDAFKKKYGPPCLSSVEKWVSQTGIKRQNPVFTWCFKTGKLKAKMYGSTLDVSEIDYADVSEAPMKKPEPKIDF